MKKLISFLLVLSMMVSMFVVVTAEEAAQPDALIDSTTYGNNSSYFNATVSTAANVIDTGSTNIDIGNISTIISSSQSYSNVLGYNARLDSIYFPSIIELQHQQDPSNNGKLIAALSLGETGRPSSVSPSLGVLLESTDNGETWKIIFRPVETFLPQYWAGQMAHIYELPAQVGDMPAGTLIYSVNTVNYDYYSHISMFISYDAGETWTQSPNFIATGGGLSYGVWEPVMFYDNGYLYCFYSDDRANGITGPDQKIVYQRSRDGVNWEDPVDVYSSSNYKDRPGMPIITKMGNGEYFLVYENGIENSDVFVYYKTTKDITNWNSSDPGQVLTAKYKNKDYWMASSPFCVWTPAGGECGTLFAMGRRQFGDEAIRLFVSTDYGKTWTTIENPLPYDWYTSAVAGKNDSIGYRSIMVLGSDPSIIHYINITETSYLGGTQAKYVKLEVSGDYQKKVVFKVANGKWDDGTTADKYVFVTLSNGSGALTAPAVGSMPNENFKAGGWDTTVPTTVSGTDDVTYIYTYNIEKVIYGDANGDGQIGMDDVVCIRKYTVSFDYDTNTSSERVEAGADFNGDGVVNMKDVILLRQYIANYNYETGSSSVVLGP